MTPMNNKTIILTTTEDRLAAIEDRLERTSDTDITSFGTAR